MEEREEETVFNLWVDWDSCVIHEERFRFAIERGNEGFGIQ